MVSWEIAIPAITTAYIARRELDVSFITATTIRGHNR